MMASPGALRLSVLDLHPNCIEKVDLGKRLNRRTNMKQLLRNVWSDQSGQDVAEYALLLAVVLAVVVTTVTAIGTTANGIFDRVVTALGG